MVGTRFRRGAEITPFDKGNLTAMLQRHDQDTPDKPSASDGAASGRRRIFPMIERAFPQFLIIAILVPLLVFGFAAYRDWQDVQAEADTRIIYVRDALAEHALRVFKTHELAAYAVRDRVRDRAWSHIEGSADLHGFLASLADSFPEIASIALVDATGAMRAGSDAFPTEPQDFSQTRWFVQLRDEHAQRLVDTDLPEDARERGAFTLAFRHDDMMGGFDGAIRLVLSPGYFDQFYRTAYPDVGVVGLVHEDGTFLTRFPPDFSIPERLEADSAFFRETADAANGRYAERSPVDGAERRYGFARVGEFPVYVTFGLSRGEMVQLWLSRLRAYGGFFIPAGAALVILALFAWRSHRELEDTVELRTAALSAAISEKNQLLKEVHHRVKNNMQIISSLIRMQERVQTSPEETVRRVQAMALVHDLIYSHGDFASVNLAAYAHRLVEGVKRTCEEDITFSLQLEPVALALDRAMPFALILSEVITNAVTHANEEGGGEVTVVLRRDGDEIELCIDDEGIGDNPEVDGRGFGLRLIKSLAVQLGARISYERKHGATFTMHFPVDPA
jgi:two-component sensor histidine kinase